MGKRTRRIFLYIASFAMLTSTVSPTIVAAYDKDFFSGNRIDYYLPDAGCSPGTEETKASSTPDGDGKEVEVGASIYGGHWDGKSFVRDPGDDNGNSATGPQKGQTNIAELSGSKGKFRALADALDAPTSARENTYQGFKFKAKFKITYKGKSIVVRKGDVGGGGGDVKGKVRAVDLWYETASLLDFKDGTDVIKIKQVPDDTAVTPVGGDASNDEATDDTPNAGSSAVCCVSPGGGDGGEGTVSGSVSGKSNQEKIWNWLRGDGGLTAEQTAGIMGNIQQESAFSPTRHETSKSWNKGGWGLAQWTASRRSAIGRIIHKKAPELEKYYNNKYGGLPKEDGTLSSIPIADNDKLLLFELQYLKEESEQLKTKDGSSTLWAGLKKQKNVLDATVYWHDEFERSADSAASVRKNRGGFSEKWFKKFQGNAASSSAACPSGAGGDVGSFQDLVKQYAWPDYKGRGFTKKTDAYHKAIETAKKEGRYVGNNGIDCGGFTTTLIYDSGWDKTYNSNAKGGPTGDQKKWNDAHWQKLGSGSSINVADLQPGDVAMSPGHTFIFVGKIDGFNSDIASASNGTRTAMAGKENKTEGKVTWYRKKGGGDDV